MELSLRHAKERHNRGVERVADQMGLPSRWALYKWMESGRLPAVLIRPFEAACGIDLVTKYLAHSAGKLVIPIPSGRQATPQEIHQLQEVATKAIGLLLSFHEDRADPEETTGALLAAMEALAWHRENIEKQAAPELALEFDTLDGGIDP